MCKYIVIIVYIKMNSIYNTTMSQDLDIDNINHKKNSFFMKGGKLLSSGAYGCVYYPTISCSGKDTKNTKYVSKIQGDGTANDNELHISKKIRKIYNYTAFFAPIIETCPIHLAQLEQGNVKSCELFSTEKEGLSKKYLLLKIPYVSDIIFTDYLYKTMEAYPKLFLHTLVYSYPYLLRSLQMLVKHNIVHYDIKGNNIMYDSLRNRPIIIDFGLSIDMDILHPDIYPEVFYVYAPDYYIWAPEVHFICYLVQKMNTTRLTKKLIREICNDIIDKNEMYKTLFSNEFMREYKVSFIESMMRYSGENIYNVIDDLLQHFGTWDQYSLSMLYLKNIYSITKGTLNKNTFLQQFIEFLMINIHPNPEYRNTVEQSIEQFTNYLATEGDVKAKSMRDLLQKLGNAQEKVYAKHEYLKHKRYLDTISKKVEIK
jgi:serine/threonine protein kinase